MNERLKKQKKFMLEIDQEKNIFRQTHLSKNGRAENDAEHAWHMAVMSFLLAEHANREVDQLKVIKMLLIHDLVEIDAGDTYAYDEAGVATQHEREMKAAKRIFGILPEDQEEELMALWQEFEDYKTPEAMFAHTLDNFQPMSLNDSNDGQDWRRHGVKKSQILKRNAKTMEGSKEIWACMEEIIDRNIESGAIIDE